MKKGIPILVIILAGIVIITIMMIANPLFLRTEGQIQRSLIRLVPIGISWDDALEVISNNESWRMAYSNTSRGYINTRLPVGERVVGEQHITVDIGRSSFLWEVRVSLAFDENGLLIDIYPRRLLVK